MTSAHICQCGISVGGVGKPVKGFPVFSHQASKRVVFCQAYVNAIGLFVVLWDRIEIMWIAKHKMGIAILVGVDFQWLLRPNSR
jgi:hypothetical protein